MNTLTIPYPQGFITNPDVETRDIVLGVDEITLLEQTNTTTSVIYIQNASASQVTLTHDVAANGSMGDALNNALLNSNGGNTVAVLPTGIEITTVVYA